jgi:hypothetical protein
MSELDNHIKSLPSDLRILIAKKVFGDIETRISTGRINKLKIPDNIKKNLESIKLPCKLHDTIYGVEIKDNCLFRMIKDKSVIYCVKKPDSLIIIKNT